MEAGVGSLKALLLSQRLCGDKQREPPPEEVKMYSYDLSANPAAIEAAAEVTGEAYPAGMPSSS